MKMRNFIITCLLLVAFLAYGCGKPTEFEIKSVDIDVIKSILYKSNDSVFNNLYGIKIDFNLNYSDNPGGQEPGNLGTRDSIINIKIEATYKNGISENFTNKLFNNNYSNEVSPYCFNLQSINEFVSSYNLLFAETIHIKKNSNHPDRKAGDYFDRYCFCFWLPQNEHVNLAEAEKIVLEIILSNGKKIKTEKVINKSIEEILKYS